MTRIPLLAVCTAACLALWPAQQSLAQQTTVTGGMQNSGNSFYESFGVGLNARGPNWFFTNGGGGVFPPFGGFDPNAGANLGFGFGGPGFSGSVNIGAAQGSSRGISSTAGSVTIPNGGSGSFAAITQQPFVTGFTPVVGGFASDVRPHFGPTATGTPAFTGTLFDERAARLEAGESAPRTALPSLTSNPAPAALAKDDPQQQHLAEAKRSSAGQAGGGSIAEIRRRQAAEDEKLAKEIQTHLDQGRAAQAAGKTGVARIHFEQAARRAAGAQKEEAQAALRALR